MTNNQPPAAQFWLAPIASAVLIAMIGTPVTPAAAESARHGWADGDSYILMNAGENGSMTMHGSGSDLRRARELRTGTEPLLYIRRGGKAYVVRDAALLQQAQAIFKPQQELGRKQAALGARQAALGTRQAELGAKQAELASRQVASRGGSEDYAHQQGELGRQQGALGEQQGALGQEQGKLGEQQARLGREAQAKFRVLVDDAIRRGLAREIG